MAPQKVRRGTQQQAKGKSRKAKSRKGQKENLFQPAAEELRAINARLDAGLMRPRPTP